jgi:hypothetical protein
MGFEHFIRIYIYPAPEPKLGQKKLRVRLQQKVAAPLALAPQHWLKVPPTFVNRSCLQCSRKLFVKF